MGDDDLELLLFAEKNSNEREWELLTYFEGNCLIGCEGRKLLKTRNLLTALRWADYHTSGPEHVSALLKRREGSGVLLSDPTHGRIDRDIQDQVAEMNPQSLGQRVAMENTLQYRRNGGTGAD